MEVVIRNGPRELKRAGALIATAAHVGDAAAEDAARREYVRLRAQVLIKFGEELLASVEGADVQ